LAGNSNAANLIVNGDFETTSNGTDKQLGYSTDNRTYKTDAVGWTTNGYNFLYAPGKADVGGALNSFNQNSSVLLTLWSSRNGGVDFMPETSPSGGNFLALDGGYEVDEVIQVISGLTQGTQYDVSFWWAAAQQTGFYGDTTEQLKVSLGGQSFLTNQIALPNQRFSGWVRQTFTFTADSVSPVLSFLAIGTPTGLPPFALLDGVTLQATVIPEASTCLIGAFLACGLAFRRSRKNMGR
jgi:hypothetical protein